MTKVTFRVWEGMWDPRAKGFAFRVYETTPDEKVARKALKGLAAGYVERAVVVAEKGLHNATGQGQAND